MKTIVSPPTVVRAGARFVVEMMPVKSRSTQQNFAGDSMRHHSQDDRVTHSDNSRTVIIHRPDWNTNEDCNTTDAAAPRRIIVSHIRRRTSSVCHHQMPACTLSLSASASLHPVLPAPLIYPSLPVAFSSPRCLPLTLPHPAGIN